MTFYTLPWSRWNRTHKYVRFTIRNSWIWSEMSWSSIHTKIWTLKQLQHCPQWCSRYKRGKNCEESRWRSQSALVQPLATACLNRCQDLIGKHQLIVPSTLLALATNIRIYKDAKPQRYIRSHHWHMSYFFKIAQYWEMCELRMGSFGIDWYINHWFAAHITTIM